MNLRTLCTSGIALIIHAALAGTPEGSSQPKHISFTENKGQVSDQHSLPRPDVLFSGNSNGLGYHLKHTGISYQLSRVDNHKERPLPRKHHAPEASGPGTIYRIDINWLNCNASASIETGAASQSYSNYYLAHCSKGIFNVKSYSNLCYKGLYPGIDLKWYEKAGQLKYDYLVAAGADYTQIAMEINGAEKISLNKNGDLVVQTPLGDIVEQAPFVTQNNKVLHSGWRITGNVIRFVIDHVNTSQPLIIDPLIRSWGTYFGGNGGDYGQAVALDQLENVYMAGSTTSTVMIATSGAYQTTYGGYYDAYLAKYSTSGTLQWSTYFGNTGGEDAEGCVVDANGNVYITGATSSTTGIATSGSFQQNLNGTQDAFLAKFNGTGALQWATYLGGDGFDGAYSCALDGSNNIYIAGQSTSTLGLSTPSSHQATYGGSTDAFLAKFSSSGWLQWCTYYGGTAGDAAWQCTTDGSGSIFISGETMSSQAIATSGVQQSVYAGSTDAFLVKFNSNGVRQWGTYYGGTGTDADGQCTADASGNVYLAGYTTTGSGSAIASASSHQPLFGGGYDGFLAKIDNNTGVRQWGTYYGGAGATDAVYGCATDLASNVYIVGYANIGSDAAMSSPGSYKTLISGNSDAFLAKFSSSGVRQYGTFYGESSFDAAYACATGPVSGNIYMSGFTGPSATSTGIATPGSQQPSFGGGSYNAFLVKFVNCNSPTAPVNTTPVSSQTICSGQSTTLSAIASATISWYSSITSTLALANGTSFAIPGTQAAGSYSYYTESLDACSTSTTRTMIQLTIFPTPVISVNSGTLCSGRTFTVSPSGASSYSISGASGFTVTPLSNAVYTITGTSASGCPAAGPALASVSVIAIPVISSNNGTICPGSALIIMPSGALHYTLAATGSTVTGTSFTVSPSVSNVYTVTGANAPDCVSGNTALSDVMVLPQPSVTVNSSNDTICIGQSAILNVSGASLYQWSTGDDSTSLVVSPGTTTVYTVTGIAVNGCISTVSFQQSVRLCTGISTIDKNEVNVHVYPNPANGLFYVELTSLTGKIHAELYDALGRQIHRYDLNSGNVPINIRSQADGVYLLRVLQNDTYVSSFRLVKAE